MSNSLAQVHPDTQSLLRSNQNGVPQLENENQKEVNIINVIEQTYLSAKIQASDSQRKKLQSLEESKKYWLINANRSIRLYYKQAPCNIKFSIIYGLSILLSLLILLFIIFSELNIDMTEFQIIYNNVNSDIIDDIQFVYYNTTCQRYFGDKYSPLFQYEWPGTQMSCNCSHQLSDAFQQNIQQLFQQYFTIGKSCTKANLSNGCETVYEQTPKNFSGWNDNRFSEPFILCGKRASGVNLRTNYTLCQSENSTICGSGNFTFCVPNNTSCPITKLGFTLNSTLYEPGVLKDTGNGFYFYFLKNTSSLPIVQLNVTEGDAVCRDNLNNISPNREDYPLMRVKREACSLLDEQYTKIDQINEQQFYYANRISYLEQMLPYFYTDSNYNWTLFQKTYILQKCDGNIIEELISNVNSINTHNKLYEKLLITSILYFIIIGIIYNSGQLATYNYYLWPFHLNCLKQRNICKYIWLTINFVVSGIFFLFIVITFSKFLPLCDFFYLISFNDCFIDSTSVSFIRDVNDTMFTVKIYLLLSLIVGGLQALSAGGLILLEIIQDSKGENNKVPPFFNEIKGIVNQNANRHLVEANKAFELIAKLDNDIVDLINGKKKNIQNPIVNK